MLLAKTETVDLTIIVIYLIGIMAIGVSLYAGAKVFDYFFGIPVLYSIIIIAVVTAIYTILGGLRAIVVTDTIQAVLLLGGCFVVRGDDNSVLLAALTAELNHRIFHG